MDKRKLAELLVDHKEKALGDHAFAPREILAQTGDMAHQKEIHVITGVRRSGKSTLMRLIARYLIQQENVPLENILYLNFEDDRFAEFKTPDFQTLYEAYLEVESPSGHKYFFLDKIRELALYLASNLACLASYKKLRDTIAVNSLTTVKNYLGYFEDVYLFFPVNLFDYSLKRQMYNPAKLYCVDHALAAAMAFKFSADTGRILENIVFSELKRRGFEVYYWRDKNGKEVDFLIRQGRDITAALQVCQDIGASETRKREISGALAAAAAFGLSEAKILTADREGEEIHKGVRILYEPVWRWLVH